MEDADSGHLKALFDHYCTLVPREEGGRDKFGNISHVLHVMMNLIRDVELIHCFVRTCYHGVFTSRGVEVDVRGFQFVFKKSFRL